MRERGIMFDLVVGGKVVKVEGPTTTAPGSADDSEVRATRDRYVVHLLHSMYKLWYRYSTSIAIPVNIGIVSISVGRRWRMMHKQVAVIGQSIESRARGATARWTSGLEGVLLGGSRHDGSVFRVGSLSSTGNKVDVEFK